MLFLVPSLVVFLTKSELVKEYDISSVISVNSGAAPLSTEADTEFKEKLPTVPPLRQGEKEINCSSSMDVKCIKSMHECKELYPKRIYFHLFTAKFPLNTYCM